MPPKHLVNWVALFLLCAAFLLPNQQPSIYAAAEATPVVSYANNTIYIGSNKGTPASEAITIPTLATSLSSQGYPNLLVNVTGNVWLLKASIVISTTGELAATSATISELRLDSPPIDPASQVGLNITAFRGGHLLIDGVQVSAWENGVIDTVTDNGRSYLLALEGGRMDIMNSEIHHLGYKNGEPSGISWRKRTNENDPTTGATGSLVNNNIHDNYFGMYSYAAYNVQIIKNRVHNNLGYGIDPHTGTQNFYVFDNEVWGNQYHGIIFSRDCTNNRIIHNTVHDNVEHGIMLDRGSNGNFVEDNTVYNNDDGISIFQSKDNTVKNNKVYSNNRGIRINATFDLGDEFDGVSSGNQVISNTFTNNKQYGVYLYARADQNTIANNQIVSTTLTGIYIRTGGNTIDGNTIQKAGLGISIVGGDSNPPGAKPPLFTPGQENTVKNNTLSNTGSGGIRIQGGVSNTIGPNNTIENSASDGISINKATALNQPDTPSTDNQIVQNTIRQNGRYGILIKDPTSARNKLSQNRITANASAAIKIDAGAQGGSLPPTLPAGQPGPSISGTAKPNSKVELYSDPAGQAAVYIDTVTADAAGNWTYTLANAQNPANVTALQIDSANNSSALSGTVINAKANFTVTQSINQQASITVTSIGAVVTLNDIKNGIEALKANAAPIHCGSGNLLRDLGNGVWQLNANLFIGNGVTLNLGTSYGAKEVKLCSQAGSNTHAVRAAQVKTIASADASLAVTETVDSDYLSFISIRAYNGNINIDQAYIHSWNEPANDFDRDRHNGRSYLLAKYDASMNIKDSELSYLGSADDESYGLAWRDINSTDPNAPPRTRVTGQVIHNNIHDNFYGVYTFQATDMVFRDNEFHHNVGYGFDPHDFTHDVTVDNNQSHDNGTHGFIISRGCNNFTFTHNKAYNNGLQGFMLDPGASEEKSKFPQASSHDNILSGNEAYDNLGFGIRLLKANNNKLEDNKFYRNSQGIVLDESSIGNTVTGNIVNQNTSYGIITQEWADNNTVSGNTVFANQTIGIYLHSSGNIVASNVVSQNVKAGIALALPLSTAIPVTVLTSNQVLSNTVINNGDSGLDLRNNVRKTDVQGNLIDGNKGKGIYLSGGPNQNTFAHNVIRNNGWGIQATGTTTVGNTWSENSIYGNFVGAILLSNGANNGLPVPSNLAVTNGALTGLASPGGIVEVFGDNFKQAQFFLGRTTADQSGKFAFPLPTVNTAYLSAIQIDGLNNASSLAFVVGNPAIPTSTPVPGITPTDAPEPGTTPSPVASATSTPRPETTPSPSVTLTGTAEPGTTPSPVVTTVGTPVGNGGQSSQSVFLPLIQR